MKILNINIFIYCMYNYRTSLRVIYHLLDYEIKINLFNHNLIKQAIHQLIQHITPLPQPSN